MMNASDGELADLRDRDHDGQPQRQYDLPAMDQFMNKMKAKHFFAVAQVLMTYLKVNDTDIHYKAKQILTCHDMNQHGESANGSFAQSLITRFRATVGETYWKEATGIFLKQIAAAEGDANVMRLLCDDQLDTLKIAPLRDDKFNFLPLDEVPTIHLGKDGRMLELTDLNGFDWLGYFIGKSKKLRELNLNIFGQGIEAYITSKPMCRFIQGINCNKSIRKLRISYYGIKVRFAIAFTHLLRNNVNLTDFEVDGIASTEIEDARQTALAITHFGRNSLKNFSVSMTNLKQVGFLEISAIMNAAPQLEQFHFLGLVNTHIDDQGAHALVSRWANCPNLKSIRLGKIHDNWLRVIAPTLPNFHALTDLDLSNNHLTDEGIRQLAPSLASCVKLTKFDISVNEWHDNGMEILASALANSNELRALNISEYDCTAVGILSLREMFQSAPCSLSRLGIFLDNDSMIGNLIVALEGNKSLKYLDFEEMPRCSDQGWVPLCNFLCNRSSISNTYSSNHTLETLIYDDREEEEREPENIFEGSSHGECEGAVDIGKFLELNKRSNKRDVSIAKILMSHNHSAFDMGLLFNWNLSFLPLMLAWLQRADWLLQDEWPFEVTGESIQVRELSTIYEFVNGNSMVVVQKQRKFLNSRKRKFETLEMLAT